VESEGISIVNNMSCFCSILSGFRRIIEKTNMKTPSEDNILDCYYTRPRLGGRTVHLKNLVDGLTFWHQLYLHWKLMTVVRKMR